VQLVTEQDSPDGVKPSRRRAAGRSGAVLVIQIPCYNEAQSLPVTLAALPRALPGFAQVLRLVVDDGSSDGTHAVAHDCGVDRVVRHTKNLGLARAFVTGIEAALELRADVIVNTDADNQYRADCIAALVAPIVEGRADIVVGARPIAEIAHFSWAKKLLQRLGSWVVRLVSRTDVPDAPSGFRAFSRSAARQIMVFGDYTYTLETLIQAGQKNLAVASVPVGVNPDMRPSRLVRSNWSYVCRSMMTIVRIFVIYRPFRFFMAIGAALFLAGFVVGLRFLWLFLEGAGQGNVQSLILAAILMIMGFQAVLVAFLADLIAANRRMLESLRVDVRQMAETRATRSSAGATAPDPPS
jgi:glycosyltransferase involved in cell wall biosynthesis